MSTTQSIHDIIEDHALERVHDRERHGWLAMSWNSVGIVTTLVQSYVGALITFIAGMKNRGVYMLINMLQTNR